MLARRRRLGERHGQLFRAIFRGRPSRSDRPSRANQKRSAPLEPKDCERGDEKGGHCRPHRFCTPKTARCSSAWGVRKRRAAIQTLKNRRFRRPSAPETVPRKSPRRREALCPTRVRGEGRGSPPRASPRTPPRPSSVPKSRRKGGAFEFRFGSLASKSFAFEFRFGSLASKSFAFERRFGSLGRRVERPDFGSEGSGERLRCPKRSPPAGTGGPWDESSLFSTSAARRGSRRPSAVGRRGRSRGRRRRAPRCRRRRSRASRGAGRRA